MGKEPTANGGSISARPQNIHVYNIVSQNGEGKSSCISNTYNIDHLGSAWMISDLDYDMKKKEKGYKRSCLGLLAATHNPN